MHTLPNLPYDYSALEPYIDARTMEIHHSKHHQGYVNNLNKALEGYDDLMNKGLKDLLSDLDSMPEEIRTAVQNNGGGHYNHSLFWTIMSPDGGGEPEGDLAEEMNKTFGGFEEFKEQFTKAAMGRFGSGWAWLCFKGGKLDICSTKNQNNPLMHGAVPIMGIDVWEHAYYLKYQNLRGDYVNAWWNVVNWGEVSKRFENAKHTG